LRCDRPALDFADAFSSPKSDDRGVEPAKRECDRDVDFGR
jgi:hypothetical protein